MPFENTQFLQDKVSKIQGLKNFHMISFSLDVHQLIKLSKPVASNHSIKYLFQLHIYTYIYIICFNYSQVNSHHILSCKMFNMFFITSSKILVCCQTDQKPKTFLLFVALPIFSQVLIYPPKSGSSIQQPHSVLLETCHAFHHSYLIEESVWIILFL